MQPTASVALLIVLASGVASAQRVPRAYLGDSTIVARNALCLLFDGIRLSATEESVATVIIKHTWRQQFVPKSGTQAERYEKALKLNGQRDSALKALLRSSGDQAVFERNAQALAQASTRPPHLCRRKPATPPQ
jgi:hypothetical protein